MKNLKEIDTVLDVQGQPSTKRCGKEYRIRTENTKTSSAYRMAELIL